VGPSRRSSVSLTLEGEITAGPASPPRAPYEFPDTRRPRQIFSGKLCAVNSTLAGGAVPVSDRTPRWERVIVVTLGSRLRESSSVFASCYQRVELMLNFEY
jgi:hypothetical protein